MTLSELLEVIREAEATLATADARADDESYRAAALAYSKASGMLLTAALTIAHEWGERP